MPLKGMSAFFFPHFSLHQVEYGNNGGKLSLTLKERLQGVQQREEPRSNTMEPPY